MTYINKTKRSDYNIEITVNEKLKDKLKCNDFFGLLNVMNQTKMECKKEKFRYSYLSKTAYDKMRKYLRDGNKGIWKGNKDREKYESRYPLLGEYLPSEKKVILYKSNIEAASKRDNVLSDVIEMATYIHEIFHPLMPKLNSQSVFPQNMNLFM